MGLLLKHIGELFLEIYSNFTNLSETILWEGRTNFQQMIQQLRDCHGQVQWIFLKVRTSTNVTREILTSQRRQLQAETLQQGSELPFHWKRQWRSCPWRKQRNASYKNQKQQRLKVSYQKGAGQTHWSRQRVKEPGSLWETPQQCRPEIFFRIGQSPYEVLPKTGWEDLDKTLLSQNP